MLLSSASAASLAFLACAVGYAFLVLSSRVYRVSRVVCTRQSRRAALEAIIPPTTRLHVPRSLITKGQFARCSAAVPAPKIEYDILRLDDPRPNGGFSHIGLPKGQELGEDGRVAVVLPAMGTTPYTRCIRRLVGELRSHGISVVVNIPRCTKGYAFPEECEPYRNYFLDLEDIVSIVGFLEKRIQEYRGKHSPDPAGERPVEVHFVGYSLGAMRAFRILGDSQVFPRILAHRSLRPASVVAAYPSFYPSVYETQGDFMQKLLGKYYCEFIRDHEAWFSKYYGKCGPVAGIQADGGSGASSPDPDRLKRNGLRILPPLDQVLRDGRLRVLDDYITAPFCDFPGESQYYREILVESYKNIGKAPGAAEVPTFIVSVADDMMAGPDVPDVSGVPGVSEGLPKDADVSIVVLNHGGHLGSVLENGKDVCSQLIRAWIEDQDAPSIGSVTGSVDAGAVSAATAYPRMSADSSREASTASVEASVESAVDLSSSTGPLVAQVVTEGSKGR